MNTFSSLKISILRMHELAPSIAQQLLLRGMVIVTTPLINVVKTAICLCNSHQLRERFSQQTPVLLAFFELLLRLGKQLLASN
jgi:hypothetical protein